MDQTAQKITLENKNGVRVSTLNYGAALFDFTVPDRQGKMENILLGFDDALLYQTKDPYLGTVVGRVAGRIGHGQFTLDQTTYQLPCNDGENHLHGGDLGFSHQFWTVEQTEDMVGKSVGYVYESPDGESGYPGDLRTLVTYTLTDDDALIIDFTATTNAKTLCNPTCHAYFNLSGNPSVTIGDHSLAIDADNYAPLGQNNLPLGNLLQVENTVFDLRKPQLLEKALMSKNIQNQLAGGGFDHPFLLAKTATPTPQLTLFHAPSGRTITMETTAPAVVIYTSAHMNGSYTTHGKPANQYGGIAIEAQSLPDAINHSDFGNIVLNPGSVFHSTTTFRFSLGR